MCGHRGGRIANYLTEPPAATIFCSAEPETLSTATFSLTAMSPSPRTLTFSFLRTAPLATRSPMVTSPPFGYSSARRSRFTTWYSTRNGFLNPRSFGARMTAFRLPPSSPTRTWYRAFVPLVPRPAVLPLEPSPRPTRVLAFLAPTAGRRWCALRICGRDSVGAAFFAAALAGALVAGAFAAAVSSDLAAAALGADAAGAFAAGLSASAFLAAGLVVAGLSAAAFAAAGFLSAAAFAAAGFFSAAGLAAAGFLAAGALAAGFLASSSAISQSPRPSRGARPHGRNRGWPGCLRGRRCRRSA